MSVNLFVCLFFSPIFCNQDLRFCSQLPNIKRRFVDVIDAGGREDCNNITATGDFWFERNDGDYNYVPRNLSDIPSNYVKEACYEGMGKLIVRLIYKFVVIR